MKTESGEVWEGEFDEDFLRDLTKKSGSDKNFKTFIKMLYSAFEKKSKSVMVDILTARDLEVLRERKMREAQGQAGTASS